MKIKLILLLVIFSISTYFAKAQNVTDDSNYPSKKNNSVYTIGISFFENDNFITLNKNFQVCFLDSSQHNIVCFHDTLFKLDISILSAPFTIQFKYEGYTISRSKLKIANLDSINRIEFGIITQMDKMHDVYSDSAKFIDSYNKNHPEILKKVFYSPQKRYYFQLGDKTKFKEVDYIRIYWNNESDGTNPPLWYICVPK